MQERIVLIGAGSAVFTRGLVADLIRLDWRADVALVDIDPGVLGINHLTWFINVRSDGQDAMGQLRAIAAQKAANPLRQATPNDDPFGTPDDDPFSWWLMHLFGAFPAVLDRHVTEFFPQFFRDGSYWGCKLGVDTFHFEGTIAEGDSTFAEMRAVAYDPQPMDPASIERGEGEHEQVMDIIDSIRRDRNLVFSANVPNTGLADELLARQAAYLPGWEIGVRHGQAV